MIEDPAQTLGIAGQPRRWRAAAVAWIAVVAAASLVPGDVIATVPRTASLAGHAVAYAVLAYLLARLRWPVWGAAVGAWCYGALIEMLQLLSPGRSLEAVDLVANATGVAVAAWIIWTWDRVRAGLVGRSV